MDYKTRGTIRALVYETQRRRYAAPHLEVTTMNRIRTITAIAAAAAAMLPQAARAQSVVVKAGYSYSSVPNNNGALPGTLSSHDGVAAGIGLVSSGLLGWGVEGMYAERGFNSSSAGSSQRLSYVDVPAYLRVAIPLSSLTPYALAGPQGSYQLNCDAGGTGSCPSGQPKWTYAGVIGAGLKFGSLAGLSVEGRYVYGLTDLHLSTVSNSDNYKSRSFMILAGLGF